MPLWYGHLGTNNWRSEPTCFSTEPKGVPEPRNTASVHVSFGLRFFRGIFCLTTRNARAITAETNARRQTKTIRRDMLWTTVFQEVMSGLSVVMSCWPRGEGSAARHDAYHVHSSKLRAGMNVDRTASLRKLDRLRHTIGHLPLVVAVTKDYKV